MSKRRLGVTNGLPCHGGRKHEIDDTDESHNLLPGIAGHLGGVVSSVAGYALLTSRTKLYLQVKTRFSERQLRGTRSKVNNVEVSVSVSVNASGSASVRILNKSSVILWNDPRIQARTLVRGIKVSQRVLVLANMYLRSSALSTIETEHRRLLMHLP